LLSIHNQILIYSLYVGGEGLSPSWINLIRYLTGLSPACNHRYILIGLMKKALCLHPKAPLKGRSMCLCINIYLLSVSLTGDHGCSLKCSANRFINDAIKR
jgi:hypothetical protein